MVNLDVIAELGGRLRGVLPDEPALAFAASPLVVSIFTERLETLGWPPELNVTVNLDVADGGAVGGPVAELPRLLQVAKRIWGSGWVEVMLGDGRIAGNEGFFFIVSSSPRHDLTDPKSWADLIAALRGCGWRGTARISISIHDYSGSLKFTSTPRGPATEISWPIDRGVLPGWGERFIAQWNVEWTVQKFWARAEFAGR